MTQTYTWLFLSFLAISMLVSAKNYNAVQRNRLRITQIYQNQILIRPLVRNLSYTAVAVGLGIIEVIDIDPQQQVIKLNANIELKWCDNLLRWNTSEQACLAKNRSVIFFTAHEIWTPDVLAANGPGALDKRLKLQYPISVTCTGLAQWSYQEKITAFCEFSVTYFPFDRQYCTVQLQSTIYDSSQLQLRSLYNAVRLYNYINTEWQITHATIKEFDLYNAHYDRNFSTLQIDMELVRLSRYYIVKIIAPFCIISSLAAFSFCLPTDSGEKIALTVSILLSLIIYLQLVSSYVPKTELGFCTLTLYANVLFLLVFFSCIFNTFTMFIYYHEQFSYRRNAPKRRKNTLHTVHKSLIRLNKQRWTLFHESRKIEESEPEETNTDALELLHDLQYFRQSLGHLLIRQNPIVSNPLPSLIADDLPYFSKSQVKRSMKRVAEIIDHILLVVYIILLTSSILILFHSKNQSNLISLAKTNMTSQLIDLRLPSDKDILRVRTCPQ